MRTMRLLASAAVLLAGFTVAAQAKDKVFALVPKAMNNPFFDQARDGCQKAAQEIGGVECYYIGPGEHGGGDEQFQMVQDLIAKKVDGLAVSVANAAAIGRAAEPGGRHPVRDLGQRSPARGQGPSCHLYRHGEHRDRQGGGQASDGAEARWRHLLHPERRSGCREPQRAHQGHGRDPAGRQVEAGGRLPAIQQ